MSGNNALDSNLVVKAQQGDDAARERIMVGLEPILRAFFIKRIGYKTEVDDLVQNTLIRVHKGLGDLKNNASLKAFSLKAALFELQDLYRGRYSAKESLYDPDHSPGETLNESPSSTYLDLEKALDALSPKARRIIELREYGYRYEEIAQMVGSTEAAIKMQVKRAFEKMRDLLLTWLLIVAWQIS